MQQFRMEIVNPTAWQYAEMFTSPEDELLRSVSAFTSENHPKGHMISGHLQGRLLAMLSRMIRPRRVLDLGTFTGYSALCLAEGLTEDGLLHTVELREQDAATARAFIEKGAVKNIKLHVGEALEMIDELDETWDLVFIDADKVNYIAYFERVFPKLRTNGFIFVDNVLFHGQVFDDAPRGKNAKAVTAFNEFIRGRQDVEKLLLPFRDGIYLIRKL